MDRDSKGFSLIELMVAVALVACLAGIAYPGYVSHLKKVYRAQIAGLLTEHAQRLERYYARNGVFLDPEGVIAGNDHYRIIPTLNLQDFILIATPAAGSIMVGDACADFSLSSTGARGNPGAAPEMSRQACWGQ